MDQYEYIRTAQRVYGTNISELARQTGHPCLCPALTNVILNVAGVNSLFGGEFANPLTAHTEYDAEATVIDLLSKRN